MADDNLERITILLQARDKDLSRALDRMNRQIARVTRDSERNTARMQQRVESHFESMGQAALTFGRNLATGLAVGAFTAATSMITTNLRQTVTSIAQVGDEARRAGIDVEAFQEWAFVAQQNRISIDALTDGFKELNLRADEFITTGAGPAAEAFQRLGFTAEDLERRLENPSELMLEMMRRMRSLDAAAQIRVADEAFGGSAGERFVELLDQGVEGLQATMARAREVGAVLDEEMIQRAADIDRRFNEIAEVIENRVKRVVLGWSLILQDIQDMLTTDDAEAAAAALAARYDDLAGEARSLQAVMEILRDAAGRIGDDELLAAFDDIAFSVNMATGAFNEGAIQGQGFGDILEAIVTQAEEALQAANGIDDVSLDNAREVVTGLRTLLAELQGQAVATAEAVAGAVGMDTGTPLANPTLPQDMLGGRRASPPPRAPNEGSSAYGGGSSGSGSTDGYRGAVEDIQARTRALELEAAALVTAAASNEEYGAAIEYARVRAQLMNEATAEGRTITPALQAEIDALAESYVTAGRSAEEAADRMRQVEQDAERGADAIGSIFEGIVQGGDAARSALSRLLSQLESSSFQRLLMGMTSGGNGGGWLSAIGSALGGKRAGGGGVQAGVPYLVNENTPNSEVFIPSRSGGVLNVAQARDAMRGGGGAPVINIANYTGQPVEQTGQRSNSDGQREIDLAIGRSIGRGRQDGAMARFGAKPRALSR